jgi:hypothetical protein
MRRGKVTVRDAEHSDWGGGSFQKLNKNQRTKISLKACVWVAHRLARPKNKRQAQAIETNQIKSVENIRTMGLITIWELINALTPENVGIIDIAVGGDSPVLIDLAVNSVLIAVELANTLVSTPVNVTDVIRVRDSV